MRANAYLVVCSGKLVQDQRNRWCYATVSEGTANSQISLRSPYNQYVACQLACILKQFYGVNSNSLTSSYYVKKFFSFHVREAAQAGLQKPDC